MDARKRQTQAYFDEIGDSVSRMRIKYALNFALPEPFADRLPGQLIARFVGDEAQLAQDWFVTLQRADGVLGEPGYRCIFIYGVDREPWLDIAGAGFSRLDRFDCIRFPPRGNTPIPWLAPAGRP